MNSQKTIGKRGIKVKDVQELNNKFGRPVYIVTKEGYQSTILDYQQIQDLQQLKRQQKNAIEGVNPQMKYHIMSKPPPNLTEMQRRKEEKEQRRTQRGPQTQISRDTVPSVIYNEEVDLRQCFDCLDKNHNISNLIQLNQSLKNEYQQKILQRQAMIQLLMKKIAESDDENKRLRQSSKKYEQKHTEIQQKCKILQQNLNGCETIMLQFQSEKNVLSDRIKSLSQSLLLKSERREQTAKNTERCVSTLDIVDKMIEQSQIVLQRMSSLERQNKELKIDNEAKKSRIQELLNSRISQAHQEAGNPEGKPVHPPLSKPQPYINQIYSQSCISIPSQNRDSEIFDSLIMPPEEDAE